MLYTLTHTDFPFAAAISNDNYDPSYLQSALRNWASDDTDAIGAPSFGEGLQRWVKEAPGFGAERVKSPLLMMGQSGNAQIAAIGGWEMFSRLRKLLRPVEMYLMPGIDEHPSHSPQNPSQLLPVQKMTVDWFTFWLGDPETRKLVTPEEASRWTALREMRDANRKADLSDQKAVEEAGMLSRCDAP